MNSKKTILVVAPYYPPHIGGLERYAEKIVSEISARGEWRVEVLTTSDTGEDETEVRDGYTLHKLAYSHRISNTPVSLSWFVKVPKLLRSIQPDLVHVHASVPGLTDLCALFLKRSTPLLITYHMGSMQKGGKGLGECAVWLYEHGPLHYLLGRAAHIVCVSEYVRSGFLARYKHKSVVVTPAVDTDVFHDSVQSKRNGNTLLFVASLERGAAYKGLSTLLQALPRIVAMRPDTVLRVAGAGDMQPEYEQMAQELGVEHSVVFLGHLTRHELAKEYQEADVFVLPTAKESFGMVLVEAMASGLPVVSTAVGGIPEIIEHGVSGYLVAPDDPDGLTEHILTLLNSKELRNTIANTARTMVHEQYGWTERVQTYERLYTELVTPRSTIVHLAGFHPPHVGGLEVVADELAKELALRSYDVRVVTSNLGARKAPGKETDTNYILRRLKSVEIAHTPILWSLPFRLMFMPARSIFHVHVAQAGMPEIALLVAKLRGFPYIAHFHLDVEPSGKLGRVFLWYKKHILPKTLQAADRVLVFSEEQKKLVQEIHGVDEKRISIVPNGVNATYFREYNPSPSDQPLKLLSVGRLTNQKRVDRLIEAVGLMDVPVHLTIVGDGEDRDELEKLAAQKARGRIAFVGKKTPAQVRAHHKKADAFVIPSDKEGMPIAVLEAMAAGLPIVGANVLGVRELVGGVGVLVDDPSPETFATALTHLALCRDELRTYSEKSITCARAHAWPTVVTVLESIYREVET